MSDQVFANNAIGQLSATATVGTTLFNLSSGDGAKFPALSGSAYFLATLFEYGPEGEQNHEIVKVTAIATDQLTVVRAQDGTAEREWPAGTPVQLRLTAGTLESLKSNFANLNTAGAIGSGASQVAAGNHTHSTYNLSSTLTGASVYSTINIANGIVTGVVTRTLTPANIGAATSGHDHSGVYAPVNHNHDSAYAPITHNHDGAYAAINHNHDLSYANINHTHSTFDRATSSLTGAIVFSNIVVSNGIVTAIGTRTLTAANIGAASTSHNHAGVYQPAGTYNTTIGTDTDLSATGANVVSSLALTNGVITGHATRTLTPANIGALASSAKASQAQAEAGADDTNYMTALKTKQAIDALAAPNGQAKPKTVSIESSLSLTAEFGATAYVRAFCWKPDGLTFWVWVANPTNKIMELSTTTPHSFSGTIALVATHTEPMASGVNNARSMNWILGGTKLVVVDSFEIGTFTCTTPYDLTTATLESKTTEVQALFGSSSRAYHFDENGYFCLIGSFIDTTIARVDTLTPGAFVDGQLVYGEQLNASTDARYTGALSSTAGNSHGTYSDDGKTFVMVNILSGYSYQFSVLNFDAPFAYQGPYSRFFTNTISLSPLVSSSARIEWCDGTDNKMTVGGYHATDPNSSWIFVLELTDAY